MTVKELSNILKKYKNKDQEVIIQTEMHETEFQMFGIESIKQGMVSMQEEPGGEPIYRYKAIIIKIEE